MQCVNCKRSTDSDYYSLKGTDRLIERCLCSHCGLLTIVTDKLDILRNTKALKWHALNLFRLTKIIKYPIPECTQHQWIYAKWYKDGQAKYCLRCGKVIEVLKKA